jgi:hypothetical protein
VRSRRVWFQTIGLSVTVAVLSAVAIALLTAVAVAALGQKAAEPNSVDAVKADAPKVDAAKVQVFSGVLTDAHCGARHPAGSKMSAGDCARMCLKQGSAWALVDGNKVYVIKGDLPDFDKRAGERVKLSGTLEADILQVRSIEAPD